MSLSGFVIRNAEKFDPNQASTSTGITSKLDQEVLQNLPPDILQEVVANERSRLKLPQDERGSSSRVSQLSQEEKIHPHHFLYITKIML